MDAALRHLQAHPGRHALYPALRLLRRRLGGEPDDDGALPAALAIRQSDSLAFAGAEIESLRLLVSADGLAAAELVPASGSLLGAHGALPVFYTELLAERGAAAPRAFLDLFAQRLTAAGYRAWRKSRPALQAEHRGRDAFRALLLALAGDVGPGDADSDSEADADRAATAFHAGAVTARRNADALERVLRRQFGAPARLEPWAPSRHRLPDDGQPRLGTHAVTLGHDAVIGPRVEQRDLRVRLSLGPLDRGTFTDLSPGGRGRTALTRWLRHLLGERAEVDLRLVLRYDAVAAARLGADAPSRLGCDAFLLSRPADADRADAATLLFATR